MNKGEVWLCSLPNYEGKEQRGTRPCIILTKSYLELITIIPLTSNLQALRFNNTIKVSKNNSNNLEKDSVALIFQIQTLDSRRMLKKLGNLDKKQGKIMDKLIKDYLEL